MSTQRTRCPAWAKQAAETSPTYPAPITAIRMFAPLSLTGQRQPSCGAGRNGGREAVDLGFRAIGQLQGKIGNGRFETLPQRNAGPPAQEPYGGLDRRLAALWIILRQR